VIALIDYGAGNLTSVKKALTFLGADFLVPGTPAVIDDARGIIVPGVGHFAATAALEGAWYNAIAAATDAGKPLLGICLGMQWLFEGSDEAPDVKGLGVMKGRITRLRGDAERQLKVPHVGWNSLEVGGSPGFAPARLLRGIASGSPVYFTHSFAAPVTGDTAATTSHRDAFASVVERDNIFGVQFHPEKSSDAGLQMLRNFLEVCGR
jgi:imidazole glycerol-phosphate synthase subunit HisH